MPLSSAVSQTMARERCPINTRDAEFMECIRASFERRGVGIPQDVPFALTDEFLGDPQKTRQWNAFVSRLYPGSASPSLEEVGVLLRAFLLPCILSVSAAESTAHSSTPSLH